jgi:hypothetical protein
LRTGFRERAANVAERAVDETEESVLHLGAPRQVHRRTVAFRHMDAMVDVVLVFSDLNVENLDAKCCQRSDE